MSRPEHIAPPELFYNESEAGKYTANSRIQAIQTAMAERCLELLHLPEDDGPRLILDIGCGSGLSGGAFLGTKSCLSYLICVVGPPSISPDPRELNISFIPPSALMQMF